MSKAFTREDDSTDLPVLPTPPSPLPPGTKNLLTPEGERRLRAELARLHEQERPRLFAAAPDDLDAKRELAQVDQRIRYLQQSLAAAEVVPPTPGGELVRFGSTVTVRDGRGEESTYRIVGVDEADFEQHQVSWRSPIARALLNAQLGQRVALKIPSGATELEIISIG